MTACRACPRPIRDSFLGSDWPAAPAPCVPVKGSGADEEIGARRSRGSGLLRLRPARSAPPHHSGARAARPKFERMPGILDS